MHGAQFVELFAGIGLVRLSLDSLGWHCVFANDIDPRKGEIYEQNFGGDELRLCDIRAVHAPDIPGAPSLLTGSFPCIDLSLAGWRAGLGGSHSSLYWELERLVGELADEGRPPSFLLLENVTGLLTSHKGADLREIVASLNARGYRCDLVVLDARLFVPQSRPRLFVLGARDEANDWPLRPLKAALEVSTPELRPPAVERFIAANLDLEWGRADVPRPRASRHHLRDILERLPDTANEWWSSERVNDLLEAMSPRHREVIDRHRASGRSLWATVFRRTRGDRAMAEVRADGVAGCLRVARGGSSKQILVAVQDGRVRARLLTPRECARLQGVPEHFRFDVSRNQALSGFGDAVCVPVVRWIAAHAFPIPVNMGVHQVPEAVAL